MATHRPKYVSRACEQAPALERLIKNGLPIEVMVASVLVAKYAWHLPLYRQAQILGRLAAQSIEIKRAVLAFWIGIPPELKPVHLRLGDLILASAKIAVDETIAPVLDLGRSHAKQALFQASPQDDGAWGGTNPPTIAFSYAPGRGAIRGLKQFEGHRAMRQPCRRQRRSLLRLARP